MDRSAATPLARQVARARRRLLAQTFVAALAWAWSAALLLSAGWFFVRPHLFADCCPGALWAVPGGLLLAGAVAAFGLAWSRRPSALDAALELDARFGLKERATTGLTLGPREADSPAGLALLDDAARRVAPLRVADRFPVRLTRGAALVPASALLMLVAFLCPPQPAEADEPPPEKKPLTKDPVAAAEIEQKKKLLQKQPEKVKRPEEAANPNLEKLLDDVDKLAQKPTGSREEAQDAVKDFGQVEDKLRDREKEVGERADALRQQMQDEARLAKKPKPQGPGEKVDQAVRQGDLRQAEDELKRLIRRVDPDEQKRAQKRADDIARQLKQEGLPQEERERLDRELADLRDLQPLNDREREQLEQALKDLQEQAERLGDLGRRQRELADQAEKNRREQKGLEDRQKGEGLNQEEKDRLAALRDAAEKLGLDQDEAQKLADKIGQEGQQDLKDLADKLGQAARGLKDGQDGDAARQLAEAARKMGKLDGGAERQQLAREAAKVAQARQALCRALDQGGPASGQRPEKANETQDKAERARSEIDPRGQLRVRDLIRGDGMKGPRKPAELQEEIRQAAQDAPEALDRQRLPRSAVDMARGYFEKLRGPDKDR
jgi:hypothetical protein